MGGCVVVGWLVRCGWAEGGQRVGLVRVRKVRSHPGWSTRPPPPPHTLAPNPSDELPPQRTTCSHMPAHMPHRTPTVPESFARLVRDDTERAHLHDLLGLTGHQLGLEAQVEGHASVEADVGRARDKDVVFEERVLGRGGGVKRAGVAVVKVEVVKLVVK